MKVEKPEVLGGRLGGHVAQQQATSHVLDDLDRPHKVTVKVMLCLEVHAFLDLVDRQRPRMLSTTTVPLVSFSFSFLMFLPARRYASAVLAVCLLRHVRRE